MRDRMRQVLDLWGLEPAPAELDLLDELRTLLWAMVDDIVAHRSDDRLWLAFVAIAGAFPGVDDMDAMIDVRDTGTPAELRDSLLARSVQCVRWATPSTSRLRLVTDAIVVDVHGCATSSRHTGIQRVERETIPRWAHRHTLELVAWRDGDGGYRVLTSREEARVLRWGLPSEVMSASHSPVSRDIVVPVGTTLVLPEVADARKASRLEALARFSGNRVAAIVYDVIPLTSPDLLPRHSGTDFLDYLKVIRECDVLAGISRSATEEFRGYFTAVGIDASVGTRLVTCELPTDAPADRAHMPQADGIPHILCVGSHEPRKNHGTVLFAAEKLWREGLEFTLEFVGGGGWGTDFDHQARALIARGRPLQVRKAVPDDELWEIYRRARFTVFPSLHEGFGLPVAESLVLGTPVIATDYGSIAEIALRGGCLTVDPRSDSEVFEAMRSLLTDDDLHARLVAEAGEIVPRTWDDYADELWSSCVAR